VRFEGGDDTFPTDAKGVAKVSGVPAGRATLIVVVDGAPVCRLQVSGAGDVSVVVPKDKTACRFGP
jgi:hypothetical protein